MDVSHCELRTRHAMELRRLLNPAPPAVEKNTSDVQEGHGQDADACEENAAIPTQIVAEFESFLAKYTESRCSRIKPQEYWDDLLRACKTRPGEGETRPSVLPNKNYYLHLQHLNAVEVDGVEHLVNKDNGKPWIHEKQVLCKLWPMVQESFEFESFTRQEEHVKKVCARFDNVPQRVVVKLYKLARHYRQSHGPSPRE